MVSAEINRVIGHGTATSPSELTVTPRTIGVIQLAEEESSRRGHAQIGTEHLLIGLLRDGEGIAARVLVDLGADLEAVRAQFEEFWERDDVIACRVSGRAMAAIDRLVEAGVRSTRSEAAAWLIDAGVEANSDLFLRIGTPIDGMPASRKTQANRRLAVGRPHRRRLSEPT
jgi:hypothetical protein